MACSGGRALQVEKMKEYGLNYVRDVVRKLENYLENDMWDELSDQTIKKAHDLIMQGVSEKDIFDFNIRYDRGLKIIDIEFEGKSNYPVDVLETIWDIQAEIASVAKEGIWRILEKEKVSPEVLNSLYRV